MDFTSHDIAVIEHALRFAIKAEAGGNGVKQSEYREVLTKLQNKSAEALALGNKRIVSDDGVRFDYDDSSDLL
ncbi:hypothetical protein [Paenibacillus hamazuiensis]|uniref:hypothetical protein n=1 Tax=Paenibacillus hamazuiensis TaxID=2936508 RepID=UPI00200BAFFF|nr:hypothetical protein [Paenibacillus hamazuiensis]